VFGGTNYAQGGARVTGLPGVPDTFPPTANALPIASQISTFLASTGGRASPNSLYSVWGGANDLFVAATLPSATAPAYIQQTAVQLVQAVAQLQAAGARYIIVPNVPDLGLTPSAIASGAQVASTQASQLYNLTLYAGLAAANLNVVPLDTFGLLREVVASPAEFGFVNTTGQACTGVPSSLFCTPANLVNPTAASTYVFADGVHPSTAAHRIIADLALGTLLAPGQMSMLGETPVKTREAHVSTIYGQLAQEAWLRAQTGTNLWATLMGQRVDYDQVGNAPSTKGDAYGVTIGADFRASPTVVLGGAVSIGRLLPQFGSNRGNYRQDELTMSLYGAWRDRGFYVNGVGTYGALDYETWRRVPLGISSRAVEGTTSGSNWSFGVQGGYDFAFGQISTGPLLGYLYQRITVDSFAETPSSAVAMAFGEQTSISSVGTAGWRVAYDAGRFMPYARISYAHDFNDQERSVRAQAVDTSPVGFEAPAYMPGRNWWVAALGVAGRLGAASSWNVGVQQQFAQTNASVTNVFVNVATSF
jgi:outer membrane lipase/esterase